MSASFERERVVHAVARHRDDMTAPLQRGDDAALLLRRHPPEHRRVLEHRAERVGVVGELAGVERVVGAGDADARRDRADRVRVVARDHHAAHALVREVVAASRPRRTGSAPRTPRAPTRSSPPGAPRRRARRPSARAAGHAAPRPRAGRHRRARGRRRRGPSTPSPARRAPTCRGRRTSPRSTCAPTRTGSCPCAPNRRAPGTRRRARSSSRCDSRRRRARRARRTPDRRPRARARAGSGSRPR